MCLGLGDLLDLVNRIPRCLPDRRRSRGDRLLKIPPQHHLVQQHHGHNRVLAADRHPMGAGDLRDHVPDQVVRRVHAEAAALDWA